MQLEQQKVNPPKTYLKWKSLRAFYWCGLILLSVKAICHQVYLIYYFRYSWPKSLTNGDWMGMRRNFRRNWCACVVLSVCKSLNWRRFVDCISLHETRWWSQVYSVVITITRISRAAAAAAAVSDNTRCTRRVVITSVKLSRLFALCMSVCR